MNKKIVILVVLPIIAFIGFNWISGLSNEKVNSDEIVFHITLAEPSLYTNGVYSDKFLIESGTYFFRFVPNGSSPEILSINIIGKNFEVLGSNPNTFNFKPNVAQLGSAIVLGTIGRVFKSRRLEI